MRAVNFMRLVLENNDDLDPKYFSAKGFGEFQPIVSNTSEKNRAKNRRVEVIVMPNTDSKIYEYRIKASINLKEVVKMNIDFRSSIKVKLITISVLLLAIPLLVLWVVSYTKSKASLEKQSVRDLQNNVEMTIEMIGALNDEVEKGTLSLEDAQEEVKAAILG